MMPRFLGERPSFTREEAARENDRVPDPVPSRPADDSLPLSGTVLLEERNVYGTMKLYPANKLARAITGLTNTATFTRPHVEMLKGMGLAVQTVGVSPRTL
jgi:hypothetical protein